MVLNRRMQNEPRCWQHSHLLQAVCGHAGCISHCAPSECLPFVFEKARSPASNPPNSAWWPRRWALVPILGTQALEHSHCCSSGRSQWSQILGSLAASAAQLGTLSSFSPRWRWHSRLSHGENGKQLSKQSAVLKKETSERKQCNNWKETMKQGRKQLKRQNKRNARNNWTVLQQSHA